MLRADRLAGGVARLNYYQKGKGGIGDGPMSGEFLSADFYVGDAALRQYSFQVSDFVTTVYLAAATSAEELDWMYKIGAVLKMLQEVADHVSIDHAPAPPAPGAPPPPPPIEVSWDANKTREMERLAQEAELRRSKCEAEASASSEGSPKLGSPSSHQQQMAAERLMRESHFLDAGEGDDGGDGDGENAAASPDVPPVSPGEESSSVGARIKPTNGGGIFTQLRASSGERLSGRARETHLQTVAEVAEAKGATSTTPLRILKPLATSEAGVQLGPSPPGAGTDGGGGGVYVVSVLAGGRCEEAGMRAGAQLLSINGVAPTSAEEAQAYINRAVGTVRFTVVMQAALPPAPASEPVTEAETADVPPEVQPIAASSMPESDTTEGAKEGGVAEEVVAATQPPAGEPRRRASTHTEEEVEAAVAAVRAAAAEARAALFRRAESNAAPVTSALRDKASLQARLQAERDEEASRAAEDERRVAAVMAEAEAEARRVEASAKEAQAAAEAAAKEAAEAAEAARCAAEAALASEATRCVEEAIDVAVAVHADWVAKAEAARAAEAARVAEAAARVQAIERGRVARKASAEALAEAKAQASADAEAKAEADAHTEAFAMAWTADVVESAVQSLQGSTTAAAASAPAPSLATNAPSAADAAAPAPRPRPSRRRRASWTPSVAGSNPSSVRAQST